MVTDWRLDCWKRVFTCTGAFSVCKLAVFTVFLDLFVKQCILTSFFASRIGCMGLVLYYIETMRLKLHIICLLLMVISNLSCENWLWCIGSEP